MSSVQVSLLIGVPQNPCFGPSSRLTTWNVSGELGYNYSYDYFHEHTGRVTYAQSIYDSTLDRSYEYDQLGAAW